MPTEKYYVAHHGVTEPQMGGKRTEEDNYDDGFSRDAAIQLVVQHVTDAIRDTPFAEIVVSISGNQGQVIKFGKV